jgi:hypothetical protein
MTNRHAGEKQAPHFLPCQWSKLIRGGFEGFRPARRMNKCEQVSIDNHGDSVSEPLNCKARRALPPLSLT